MPIAEAPETEDKIIIPPTSQINLMADKFKEAVAKGGIPSAAERAESATKAAAASAEKEKTDATAKAAAEAAKVKPVEQQKQEEKKTKIPAENFKILETQRDEFKTKLDAAEAKGKELEAKLAVAIDPAKIAELQAKLEKTEAEAAQNRTIVDQFYVEHSPEFQAAFTGKIDQSRAEAKESVGAEHAARIESLLLMPPSETRDKAIEEIGDELRPFQQTSLVKAYTDLKRTERERAAELAKAPENLKKLHQFNAEQSKKQQQEEAQAVDSAFKSEAAAFMQKLPEFQPIEGNEDHNTFVKKNVEMAQSFLVAKTPADRARMALWAARGVAALDMDAKKDALIEKLSTQVKELQAAGPTMGAKGGAKAGEKAAPLSIVDRWNLAQAGKIPPKA